MTNNAIVSDARTRDDEVIERAVKRLKKAYLRHVSWRGVAGELRYLYSLICSMVLISLACQSSALAPMKEATTKQVPASPTVPTQVRPESRMVCAESLHVRAEPMGEVRGYALYGQSLQVFAPVDGWSQVASGKWRGLWVRESWLCD